MLPAARKALPDELRRMRTRMILTVEADRSAMETIAFHLDGVKAWATSYATYDAWLEALPALLAKLPSLDPLRMRSVDFVDADSFNDAGPPTAAIWAIFYFLCSCYRAQHRSAIKCTDSCAAISLEIPCFAWAGIFEN